MESQGGKKKEMNEINEGRRDGMLRRKKERNECDK